MKTVSKDTWVLAAVGLFTAFIALWGIYFDSHKEIDTTKEPIPAAIEDRISYCETQDNVKIAYSLIGSGYPLVKTSSWFSHLGFEKNNLFWSHWIKALSKNNLLIRYDERGCGLSDRDIDQISFEGWILDLETVVDAIGLEKFAILGISQGVPIAIAYTIRHPDKVSHLILCGGYARGWQKSEDPEYMKACQTLVDPIKNLWGQDNPEFTEMFAKVFLPEATEIQLAWFNKLQKHATSAENAHKFMLEFGKIDVFDLLDQIKVPTIIFHSNDDRVVPFKDGQILAKYIPNAKFIPLISKNHILLKSEKEWNRFLKELNIFLRSDYSNKKGSWIDCGVRSCFLP